MANFIMLALCFVLGILLRRGRIVPDNATATINAVIIYISLPAVALLYVHDLPLSLDLFYPAFMGWIVFVLAFVLFMVVGKAAGLSSKVIGCLTLTAGLGNTSFVGLPMIEVFYGSEHMGLGLICDQMGSFMALSVLGTVVAAVLSGRDLSKRGLVKRVLLFPPFVSMLLAICLKPVPYPEWMVQVLKTIGGTLSPLALLSVGLAVEFNSLKGRRRLLALGLGYKMVLAPLVILGLYAGLLGQGGVETQVTVFEAAMAPMITGGIVAMQYDLERDLAVLLLGLGIPLSFATLPVWWWGLQGI